MLIGVKTSKYNLGKNIFLVSIFRFNDKAVELCLYSGQMWLLVLAGGLRVHGICLSLGVIFICCCCSPGGVQYAVVFNIELYCITSQCNGGIPNLETHKTTN